jgi:ATP/maltotriose-dependent transcriptional regulator MalT
MQGHLAAIRAWIAYMRRDLDHAVVLSRRALELCPQMDAAVRSGLAAIHGEARLKQNDLPGCERAYAEAVELAQSSGNIMLEVTSLSALGTLNEIKGRLHEAEALHQEALEKALRFNSPAAGQAYACLARVHREWNDLAAAGRFAEEFTASSDTWGVVGARATGLTMLASVLQAQHRLPEATEALAEVGRIIRAYRPEIRSMPWIGAMRARLWLAQGKVEEARRRAEVDQAICAMFVYGVSTQRVGEVVEVLTDTKPSPSTVSRVFHTLESEFQDWKARPLEAHYLYLFADGTYFSVIYEEAGQKMPILAVVGINMTGQREVLGFTVGERENQGAWEDLLQNLKDRGIS